MGKKSNGKLGTRELSTLIFIVMGVKATDSTPVNLFSDGLTATWMFPIVWLLTMAIPFIALLSLLKLYKNKNIIDIIYHLTGKYIGFVFCILLVLVQFSALILNSRGYIDILSSRFYIFTPQLVLYSAMIFTSVFVATRGFEGIGRTSWMVFPYLVFIMLLLIPLLWDNFTFSYLHPIGGPGVKKIATSGVKYSSLIGEFLSIALFYPFVKSHKVYRNANIIGLVGACLLMALLFAEYVMVFDFVGVQKMLHPFSQLTRHTEIQMFINNLDALFLGIWLIAGIIRFAFYLYGSAAVYGYTFKLKEYEPLILPIAVLTIILGLIPHNATMTTLILRGNILIESSWIYFFGLPILLWVLAKVKGEFSDGMPN